MNVTRMLSSADNLGGGGHDRPLKTQQNVTFTVSDRLSEPFLAFSHK